MSTLVTGIAEMSPAKRALLERMLRERRQAAARPPTEAMSVAQMLAEAVLALDIDPDRTRPAAQAASTVLLTGATGFIGAYLLDALLASGVGRVYCLVRAADEAEARRRLASTSAASALPAPDHRVVAVPGDLAAPGLGLETAAYARLAADVDAIV